MATTVLAREIAWLEPVAAFEAVRGLPWPVLLDSARADPRLGRWSYVAADPFLRLTSKDGRITLGERSFTGDPFAVLQRALAHYRLDHDPALPVPFQTGAVGWSRLRSRAPSGAAAASGRWTTWRLPDLALGFYDAVLAFDLLERRAWILSSGWPEAHAGGQHAPAQGAGRPAGGAAGRRARARAGAGGARARPRMRSNFTRAAYEAAVQRVVDYILAGDIFQANLSQRFLAELPAGWTRGASTGACGSRNPAPFAAYLRLRRGGDRLGLARAVPGAARAAGRDAADQGHAAARRARPRRIARLGAGAAGQREGPGRERDDRRSPAQRSAAGCAATTRC